MFTYAFPHKTQYVISHFIKKILLPTILGLSRIAYAQQDPGQNSSASTQGKFSPLEIVGGVGIVNLSWAPSDPHRQDVTDLGYAFGLAKKICFFKPFQARREDSL